MGCFIILSIWLHFCKLLVFYYYYYSWLHYYYQLLLSLLLYKVCPTEIISFSEQFDAFNSINTQVLAISTDSVHTHLAWTRSKREDGGVGKLKIPLVADVSKKISRLVFKIIIIINIIINIINIIINIIIIIFNNFLFIIHIRGYGVLVEDEDDDMFGAALRGLFIIDPKGIIRSIQINDDAVGRSVEETLRILKAFQWADSHVGEACPASWQPGSDTIKTNPYESKEYFKSHYAA